MLETHGGTDRIMSELRGSAVLETIDDEEDHQELVLLLKNKLFGSNTMMLFPEIKKITKLLTLLAENLRMFQYLYTYYVNTNPV